MSDSDPHPSSNNHNGPSNDDIERRTWEWFSGALSSRFGPSFYQVVYPPDGDPWPDVIAVRSHDRVGFEITSPLRPEDVVKKINHNGDDDDDGAPPQTRMEKRVVEALKRKIKKYGERKNGVPLALLITLAHPSAQRISSQIDLHRLAGVVNGHLSNFLHQPIDAVYLVGPGQRAHLLWRRRGPQWRKLFPDVNAVA